jgi:hypothetical protein
VLHCVDVARRLAIAAIIAICLGGPIAEMFDRWDDPAQSGNDTEANVVVAALCVGVTIAIGTIVIANRIRALAAMCAERVVAAPVIVSVLASVLAPIPTSSPPTILRL